MLISLHAIDQGRDEIIQFADGMIVGHWLFLSMIAGPTHDVSE
jgi:hypothetical protein